jgi:hypothetical protein
MPLTDFDALVRYLDSGHLPWPLARGGRDRTLARDGRDRMIALLTEAALGDPGALLAYAPVLVHRAAAFFFRWLQLVPESHWAVIADRIEVASRDGWVVGLGDAVGSLLHPRTQASGSHQRQLVAAALLALALRGRGALSSKGSDAQLLTLAVGAGLGDDAHASALVEALPAEARAWIGRTASQLGEVDAQSSPQVKTEARKQATPAHAPVSGPRGGHEAARTEPDDRPDQLGVAVDHAGLVILHPFLPRLLQRAGILPPGGEASLAATSLPRAAALLSLAATGADEPFEFELGFVKVLLGLRPDTDLQVSSGLVRPEDREEVEALLLSVIEHWRALKNTSVAGLRASFLQRPGLLADVGGSWRLRVEPHSIDVLLDGLPWGIGTIRLPWMTEPIATEWATP